ncbi:MAG TPA: DnaA N-terminal domain-containing protein, partial [Methylocella sp.]|nr:DnaA N-terminal domain-containing protein [Methylocella sp.]
MPDSRGQFSGVRELEETEPLNHEAARAEGWRRACRRLRAELGEEVFLSWFRCLELDALLEEEACLSVPTKFLKSWIQSHYADRILLALASEFPAVKRISM